MSKWNLEQFAWDKVVPTRVPPDILMLAKTASLVEYNSADYTAYLRNVFPDDIAFHEHIDGWGEEEKLHGLALKRWCEIVDPAFDFKASLKRFTDAFRVDVNAQVSVRGSRGRELIARCVVESGTTSYYSALRDATDDPVLKEICHAIAIDEVRHFNLFYKNFTRYQATERLSTLDRVKVILERSGEVDDEELSFAFAAANFNEPVDRARLAIYSREYLRRAYAIYQPKHVSKAVGLLFRITGIAPIGWIVKPIGRVGHFLVQRRTRRLAHPQLAAAHG